MAPVSTTSAGMSGLAARDVSDPRFGRDQIVAATCQGSSVAATVKAPPRASAINSRRMHARPYVTRLRSKPRQLGFMPRSPVPRSPASTSSCIVHACCDARVTDLSRLCHNGLMLPRLERTAV